MILLEILENAGVQYTLVRAKPNEVVLECPFCPSRGFQPPYSSPHLGINVANGLANCFLCHWSSRSVLNTAKSLSQLYDLDINLHRAVLRRDVVEPEITPVPQVVAFPEGYELFRDPHDVIEKQIRRYLDSRGVTILQIVKHKIGYCTIGRMAWRIIIPVFGEDGRVYGCVGRAVRKDMKPKYLNTPGIKLLWNATKAARLAVICEGVMDALKVEKVLVQYPEAVAIARLGSSITETQIAQLKKYQRVVVLPDWDIPGVKGAMELAKRCLRVGIRVEVAIPREMNDQDPGDTPEHQIKAQIDGAVLYDDDKHTNNHLWAATMKCKVSLA